ncbi:MAG: hypothetical protein ACLFPD_08560 [Desulfosudaceae bacterium]
MKHDYRWNDFRRQVVLALLIVLAGLGLMLTPACSGNNGEEASRPGKAVSSGQPGAAEQEMEASAAGEEEATQRQQDIERMNELQEELMALQQQVIKDTPELQQEQEVLRDLITSKLEQNLDENNVDVDRIQELQTQLQSEDLDEEKKAELLEEFRTKAQQYNQARATAMNDAEVQEKYQAYVEHLKAKMEKADPTMPETTKEIEALQSKLQPQQSQQQPPQPQQTQPSETEPAAGE